MTCAGTRRNADHVKQLLNVKITFNNSLNRRSMKVQYSSAIILVLLLVPGRFSCELIISLTFLMFSEVRTVLGRPLPGFLTTADPVSSTRLQIAFTVFTFHCLCRYFAIMTRYPRPCLRKVWIHILSSAETLPMASTITCLSNYCL